MATSGERHPRDAYDDALVDVLELPSLVDECADAARVVRCLLRPSFHPECSISIVERGAAVEMTVRVPARSVWSLVSARAGAAGGNPVTDWVRPAVSSERILMTDAAAAWRSSMDSFAQTAFPSGGAWGIDGMNVDVLVWQAGRERAFRLWCAGAGETDERHRLVLQIVKTARGLATWEQSIVGLENVRSYLGADPLQR